MGMLMRHRPAEPEKAPKAVEEKQAEEKPKAKKKTAEK